MPVREAQASWEGPIGPGKGTLQWGSSSASQSFSFSSRFEDGPGTNPEELIGAALAGCFSMALAAGLTKAGHPPTRILTKARVHVEKVGERYTISKIQLSTEGQVPGADDQLFRNEAERAKETCPVARALAGTWTEVKATLLP